VAKLLIVKGDVVRGTDKHNVSGQATNPAAPPPNVPYVGVADFTYTGAMTDDPSDLVTIGGIPVALATSRSSLDPGQDVAPAGMHSGPTGSGFTPPAPVPIAPSLMITDAPIGVGRPGAGAGSHLVSINGVPVLLDGDSIDTCDGLKIPGNSTVTSSGQSFVSASE
jgi:uncharacterized Zn-binding protein involved in type VI secretion